METFCAKIQSCYFKVQFTVLSFGTKIQKMCLICFLGDFLRENSKTSTLKFSLTIVMFCAKIQTVCWIRLFGDFWRGNLKFLFYNSIYYFDVWRENSSNLFDWFGFSCKYFRRENSNSQ